MSRERAFALVEQSISTRPVRIFFVNAHCVVTAERDREYAQAVEEAEFVFSDGLGIEVACRLLHSEYTNLNGTDWIPLFLGRIESPYTIFFLGGTVEVAQKCRELQRWPALTIVGACSGYYEREGAILDQIRKARPDILLVGMGVPRQELFLHRHWISLVSYGVKVAIAGGAILDFLTKTHPRAPKWIQKVRMEWCFRLWQEPKRLWRRYLLELLPYSLIVIKEWYDRRK